MVRDQRMNGHIPDAIVLGLDGALDPLDGAIRTVSGDSSEVQRTKAESHPQW